MKVGANSIGPGNAPYFIAEVAQAHDGSLGAAHAYIDAVATTGAQAIKFQTHIADAESSPGEAFRVNFSYQDKTRYDYWKRLEFTSEEWAGLKRHCDDVGLEFLSSAFSDAAFQLLSNLGLKAWKIASGETNNVPMLRKMAKTGLPLLVSTGMSPWSDVDQAIRTIKAEGNDSIAVFQCTTAYPTDPKHLGLNTLSEIRERYHCPVGLSDHSGAIYGPLAAISLGADLLEFHVVFSKHCFGPDTSSSLTIEDATKLIEGGNFIFDALSAPIDKDAFADQASELRNLFGKGIYSARLLKSGTAISADDLDLRKPVAGLAAAQWDTTVGRVINRDVPAGSAIHEGDLE